MNIVTENLNIKKNEKNIVYIYPSNVEQVTLYSGYIDVQSECKVVAFNSTVEDIKDELPVPPVKLELVETKTDGAEVENFYLCICKDTDYALISELPNIVPPASIVESFKLHILYMINKYLREKHADIEKKDPYQYEILKSSRDSLLSKVFYKYIQRIKADVPSDNIQNEVPSNNLKKHILNVANKLTERKNFGLNKENTEKLPDNISCVYIFPNNIENALNGKIEYKKIYINVPFYNIKRSLPINMERLHKSDNVVIVSNDFYLLNGIPTYTSNPPIEVLRDYEQSIASIISSDFIIRKNEEIKRREAYGLLYKLANRIGEDTYKLDRSSR